MTTASPTITGSDLAELRRGIGLRQADLAERLGVSRSRIRNIEQLQTPSRAWIARYLAVVTR